MFLNVTSISSSSQTLKQFVLSHLQGTGEGSARPSAIKQVVCSTLVHHPDRPTYLHCPVMTSHVLSYARRGHSCRVCSLPGGRSAPRTVLDTGRSSGRPRTAYTGTGQSADHSRCLGWCRASQVHCWQPAGFSHREVPVAALTAVAARAGHPLLAVTVASRQGVCRFRLADAVIERAARGHTHTLPGERGRRGGGGRSDCGTECHGLA